MATLTLAPFGLRWLRNRRASSPNYQANYFNIRKGYASSIAYGDLVMTGTGANQGYIVPYAEGGSAVLGVFAGLAPYYDTVAQQFINKTWWQGNESPTGDVSAMVIDDPDAVYIAQVSGGPLTIANRGQNIDFVSNGAPNALGLSTGALDGATVANTATLPLRIIGLGTLAFPSFDPSLNYAPLPTNNYAEVILNPGASEFNVGTGI